MIADNFQLGSIKSACFRWRGAEGGTCFKNGQILQKMIENHLLPWNPTGGHIRAEIFVIKTNLKSI